MAEGVVSMLASQSDGNWFGGLIPGLSVWI